MSNIPESLKKQIAQEVTPVVKPNVDSVIKSGDTMPRSPETPPITPQVPTQKTVEVVATLPKPSYTAETAANRVVQQARETAAKTAEVTKAQHRTPTKDDLDKG